MPKFDHQVAGHANNIIAEGDKIIKKETHRELAFYQQVGNSPISNAIAGFHGHKSYQFDDEVANGIILSNAIYGLKTPNLMDLKLGKILYGSDASPEKRQRMIDQANETTSGSCGIRICGMKIFDYDSKSFKSFDKSYGRSLTKETLGEGFKLYFSGCDKALVQKLIDRINEILDAVKQTFMRCGGVSLLLAYDREEMKVSAILMDFAHSEFVSEQEGVDEDLIWGLEQVLMYLRQCL